MAQIIRIVALSVFVFCFTEATEDTKCPSYWTRFRNSCYRFYGEPLSHDAAASRCHESITPDGSAIGCLVSIHDHDENSFVYQLWQSSFIDGLDAADFDGMYFTLVGSRLKKNILN